MTLALAFCASGTPARGDDLQPSMHVAVDHYFFGGPKSETWKADKKTLVGYSQEQLARALLADLELDRGSPKNNRLRDQGAYGIFRTLDLPPTLFCQELDQAQSPERKASLMFVLQGVNKPEVVQALLRQLGDRRTVIMPYSIPVDDGATPRPYRVRDVAFRALVHDLEVPGFRKVTRFMSDELKDEIIEEGLVKLKLTPSTR